MELLLSWVLVGSLLLNVMLAFKLNNRNCTLLEKDRNLDEARHRDVEDLNNAQLQTTRAFSALRILIKDDTTYLAVTEFVTKGLDVSTQQRQYLQALLKDKK